MGVEGQKVLGVLAGRDLLPGQLAAWLAWADRVVAADAGADLCRSEGREPDAIVGDLDSISDPTGLLPDPDQDSSDADKLLAFLKREGHASVTLIGVEGDRLDHVLATLYSCLRTPLPNLRLALRSGFAYVCQEELNDRWQATGRLSVLPLAACEITLTGVRWPLHHQVLEPGGLISLSNEIDGEEFQLSVHRGAAAVFTTVPPWPETPSTA